MSIEELIIECALAYGTNDSFALFCDGLTPAYGMKQHWVACMGEETEEGPGGKTVGWMDGINNYGKCSGSGETAVEALQHLLDDIRATKAAT